MKTRSFVIQWVHLIPNFYVNEHLMIVFLAIWDQKIFAFILDFNLNLFSWFYCPQPFTITTWIHFPWILRIKNLFWSQKYWSKKMPQKYRFSAYFSHLHFNPNNYIFSFENQYTHLHIFQTEAAKLFERSCLGLVTNYNVPRVKAFWL